MKNTFYVAIFIATLFCKIGLSIQKDGKKNMNYDNEGKIRNIRDLVNIMSHENYYRPMSANKSTFERSGYKVGYDDGNPDIHGSIDRPCQAYDTFCIRKYFAMHSKCKISGRRLPDPFYKAVHDIYFPSVNATLTLAPVDFLGINNARVAEFYIDKVTDNLVIAITFDGVRRISNNSYVTYHLKNREPIVTRGLADITTGIVTVTAVIPHLDALRYDKAELSAYAETPIGRTIIGPGITASSDPETQNQFAVYLANSQRSYTEELLTTGPFLLTAFLQYNICDFGIKIL